LLQLLLKNKGGVTIDYLAELVIDSIRQEPGDDQLRQRLNAIGTRVGENLRNQNPGLIYPTQTLGKLSELMEQLGYDVSQVDAQTDASAIEAHNCIFHNLAFKDPSIGEFDLALLSTFTGKEVDHHECMAKGGNVCRFKFESKDN
jgi:predicted ArsR family transcriptional regulator